MKKIIYLLILFLVVGCYKDADFFVADRSKTEQFVKSGFSGLVSDQEGNPISGALVTIGNLWTMTDINGVYFLENASVNIERAFVIVSKSEYYESSRTLTAKVNTANNLNFILTRKQEIGTFAVTAGETFGLPDGAVLEIPADVVDDFTGEANFFANTWTITDINLSLQMPGEFIGEVENGEEKSLIPYGVIVIDAEETSGVPLEINASKTIKVSIPLSDNNPPAIVPLWLFDEVEGIWIQKGTATLEGQFYVAEVSEFGYWAIADITEKVTISGTVLMDGEVVPNILMALRNVNNGMTLFSNSNSRGAFNFKVAANSFVKVGIYGKHCNEFNTSSDIQVGENNIEDQDFTISNGITQFSGLANDCNKEPITNGYAIVNSQTVIKLDEAGRFDNIIFDACLSNLDFQVYDSRSQEIAINANPENTSPVQVHLVACEDLNEFTNLNYNNRSLLLSAEAEAILQPLGSIDVGTIAIVDESIGILEFQFKGDSAGTYTVSSITFNDQLNNQSFEIELVDLAITLDETVATGEPLTGSYEGEFTDNNGATHSLFGDFRVIKDN